MGTRDLYYKWGAMCSRPGACPVVSISIMDFMVVLAPLPPPERASERAADTHAPERIQSLSMREGRHIGYLQATLEVSHLPSVTAFHSIAGRPLPHSWWALSQTLSKMFACTH